jgi:SAM-dependent methyltransferase
MPAETPADEKDYVLGTHDDEIDRLGLQHRVWRPRASDAWRRAGFTVGQTLLDVGCGPGHASIDLAEIVGPRGRVVAMDRSRRFLDALEATARRRGLAHIEIVERDLDDAAFPVTMADGAWVRWVLSFVRRPRAVLSRIAEALKPGGALVVHEYLHYETWRLAPRSPDFEEFVRVVMRSWRDNGGEPDIGLELPRWLEEAGFAVGSLRPIVDVVQPSDYVWQWPKAFVAIGLRRLVDLGHLTPERAAAVTRAFAAAEADPASRMVTPAVIEIVAIRR